MLQNLIDLFLAPVLCSSFFIVPLLIASIVEMKRELRKKKEELERQRYAHEFFVSQIEDMIQNGNGGRLLEYLIKNRQL